MDSSGNPTKRDQVQSRTLGLAPSVDVFVSDRVSLGGSLSAGWQEVEQSAEAGLSKNSLTSTRISLGAAPRVGLSIPLSETVALWPRLSLEYSFSSTKDPSTGAAGAAGAASGGATYSRPPSATHRFGGSLNLGVAFRLARNVLLDVGPRVAFTLSELEEPRSQTGSGVLLEERASALSVGARASLALVF